jgi:hypothetical protein
MTCNQSLSDPNDKVLSMGSDFNSQTVLMKIDAGGKLTTQLHDKRDDFSFDIVHFPCSSIRISPAYSVFIPQLIRYARACSVYD